MRFGIDLPTWGSAASHEMIVQIATKAEKLGFDSIWAADHLVMPANLESAYPYDPTYRLTPRSWENFFEPFVTLAYVAAQTNSVRLGTSVLVVPLRNPVYTAKLVATLDAMCGGRLILGVGAGWLREEFEAMGVGKLYERRGAVITEYLRIMRLLWTEDVASLNGEFYNLPAVHNRPKPLQRGGPPIWIGGNGRAALRRVGFVGDGWHATHASPDDLRAGTSIIRKFAEMAGRDPNRIEVTCRCELGIGLSKRIDASWHLYGSAEFVRDMVGRYRDAGCSCIVLEPGEHEPLEGKLRMMEVFAEEILARS